jgi:hypothetical protein
MTGENKKTRRMVVRREVEGSGLLYLSNPLRGVRIEL